MGPGVPVIWHTASMADTGRPDGTDEGLSLEMPSLSLRRKRKAPDEAQAAPGADPQPAPQPVPAVEPGTEPRTEPRARRQLPTIALSGIPAAAATGAVIGGLAVLLAWLATSACDVVRGTSSCGGGPGLLILVAMLVLLAYAGGLLLRVFGVPDAGSTSILAVGILAVLVLVFLLGSIDEWWMVLAIPVAAVIAYCASWWVTTAVVRDGSEDVSPEPRDVR